MIFRETKGDLFKLNRSNWVLAHCISQDVTATKNMNKGIAKTFRSLYSEMAAMIFPKLEVGKAIRFEKDGNIVYNLVSKHKVSQKAKADYKNQYYEQLKNSLEDLREQMINKNEKFLAMPRIASGLDGGNWNIISKMIQSVFENTTIEIEIRYL